MYIISNSGVPSLSRDHTFMEGVWSSFDGRGYTLRIGDLTYDWYSHSVSGKMFLAVQSPTPTFSYKSYATNECKYFEATVGTGKPEDKDEVRYSRLIPPPASYPDPLLFNANWQGDDGGFISWISNENNTGTSLSTFVMTGGKFYDLGKPILGAALNNGFIVAVHCIDGKAELCEYTTKNSQNGNVTLRKTIAFDKDKLNIPDFEYLDKSEWLQLPSTIDSVKNYKDGIIKNKILDIGYESYKKPYLEPPYFSSATRASFSNDLKKVLLHFSLNNSSFDPYHNVLLTNASSLFKTKGGRSVNAFMVFDVASKWENELEIENAIKNNFSEIPEKKFSYTLKYSEHKLFDNKHGFHSLESSGFNYQDKEPYNVKLKNESDVFLFAEIRGYSPAWLLAKIKNNINLTADFGADNLDVDKNKKHLQVMTGYVDEFSLTYHVSVSNFFLNRNQTPDYFINMCSNYFYGSTEITGDSNATISISIFPENKKICNDITFSSNLSKLTFYGGSGIKEEAAGDLLEIKHATAWFQIYSEKVTFASNRGEVIENNGSLTIPVIDIDYIDLRCNFYAISVVEFDGFYIFNNDASKQNQKIHLITPTETKEIFSEKFSSLIIEDSEKEGGDENYPSYKSHKNLKENLNNTFNKTWYTDSKTYITYASGGRWGSNTVSIYRVSNGTSGDKYSNITFNDLSVNPSYYYLPADYFVKNPTTTEIYPTIETKNITYRKTSCAFDISKQQIVYYIQGGYNGNTAKNGTAKTLHLAPIDENDTLVNFTTQLWSDFDSKKFIDFTPSDKSSYIDNHQISFYLIDLG